MFNQAVHWDCMLLHFGLPRPAGSDLFASFYFLVILRDYDYDYDMFFLMVKGNVRRLKEMC